jgi:hypothetical protein
MIKATIKFMRKQEIIMKNIKIMLWYDVEDYINPQADDALLALIKMMNRLGIRGSFKIVGEKARVLEERGRTDIIRLLSGHEVCYHTDNHSIHPTITEYLLNMGFEEGAHEFEGRERQGFLDVQRITGQFPTSYGQPGASWAPQVFPVLRKWGVPTYVDSHQVISVDEKPFWYGGILNLTRLWATMRMDLDEGGLDRAKTEFDEICNKADAEQCQLISIYYHPCEFSSTEFWDGVNYSRGINTPRDKWKPSNARTIKEMHELVNMLGEFLEYTLKKPNVEYITAQQSTAYEITDPAAITISDVREMAKDFSDGPNYYIRDKRSLCPSEVLTLFARYIQGKHLSPELLYGPERDYASQVSGKLEVGTLANAVLEQYSTVLGFKQLPDYYQIGENRLNPVVMFCTLKNAIEKNLSGGDIIEPSIGEGRLVCMDHINTNNDWGTSWVVFPEDIDVTNIFKLAQLQTWTLKPALY